jgi:hypothetical protein
MIKKIISGGQTGADRAALDFALKFGIPHGGWVPKGRKAEDGPIPQRCRLQEMPTDSYPARTEQNLIDSDGTLLFYREKITGGTAYTRKMARKHKKHFFFIDLTIPTSFDAASLILSWICKYKIEVLNVAGPRASKDPNIFSEVMRILEMMYRMSVPGQRRHIENPPKTVGEAVDRLIAKLSLRDKSTIAGMAEHHLPSLQDNLGVYIGSEFGIWSGNKDLMDSCSLIAGDPYLHEDFAPTVIIEILWKRLRETHKLRAVK